MGQVFGSSHSSLKTFIDFENDAAAPEVMQDEVNQLITGLEQALKELQNYKGQKQYITEAIKSSTPENNKAAVNALIPNVSTIKSWASLSASVGSQLAVMLDQLVSLEQQPGLAIGIAKILSLIYRFDSAKMMQPDVANDFAGYRRCIDNITDIEVPVTKEECMEFTMFTAETSPFAAAVCPLTVSEPKLSPLARTALANLANACCGMVNTNKGEVTFCFNVMVSCIILYDRNSRTPPGSVFYSKQMAIKKCIQSVKKNGGEASPFLNSIKYGTIHFKDAPASIERLLE